MGIGSVTSISSMSGMRMTTASPAAPKNKRIQNEITNVQQQMQKLSSKEELSVSEKTNERKNLQKELSSLNTELKQYQEELRKSQKREIMMAELREDMEPVKEENSADKIQAKEFSSDKADEKELSTSGQNAESQGTVIFSSNDGVVILRDGISTDEERNIDTEKKQVNKASEESSAEKESKTTDKDAAADSGLSHKEIHAMVSADSSAQQAGRLGTVIAKTSDGIAILKGEIDRDEKRGINTEKKQAELEKMENAEQRAIAFQSSILGEANNTTNSSTETNAAGTKNVAPFNVENAFINAMKVSQEDPASQQKFYVSFFE